MKQKTDSSRNIPRWGNILLTLGISIVLVEGVKILKKDFANFRRNLHLTKSAQC
ncbi:MAG: hypothetical protein WC099_00830 [Candidatus Paceibacterota bacterium]